MQNRKSVPPKKKIIIFSFCFLFHTYLFFFFFGSSFVIMGNLNSRETVQLLDNPEFKHVCKNLGDFFGSHGEYMQHRRRRISRKGGEESRESSHRDGTDRQGTKAKENRGREKSRSRGSKNHADPLKNFNWECPGGGGCPWSRLVAELLRRNPQPKARESRRRNVSQDHHRPRDHEPRHSTSYPPPQHQRGSHSRDPRNRVPPTTPRHGTLPSLLSKDYVRHYKTYQHVS